MKKFKKIALILGITLLLAVMCVVSVSASCYPIYEDDPNDSNDFAKNAVSQMTSSSLCGCSYWAFDINSMSGEYFNDSSLLFYEDLNSGNYVVIFTDKFKELYIDYALQNKEELEIRENATFDYTAESLLNFMKTSCVNENFRLVDITGSSIPEDYSLDTFCSEGGLSYSTWTNFSSFSRFAVPSNYFDKAFILEYDDYIKNYVLTKQLEEKDTSISTFEGQVAELNTTINEKDTLIAMLEGDKTALNGEIATLETEIILLEGDVEGLNTQVSSLTTRNTQLNATVKSLENQMQLKINKAYAEGLVDSEGDLTYSGIISIFLVILTIGEVVALVMFFVSRAKKRKQRR